MKGEPGIEGFLVVASVDVPALFFIEGIAGGKGEEVRSGHDAAGEEVARHPVVIAFGFV